MEEFKKEEQEIINESQDNFELHQCQIDLAQWKDSFLRVSADFENFKKRTIREKATWIEDAQADVILRLLDTVDNFDRAFSQPIPTNVDASFKNWLQGFEMIQKSLYDLLNHYDIKAIVNNLSFDPQYHEAISQIDSNVVLSGEIVETVQKGFMLKDRVLRVAKVIIAK